MINYFIVASAIYKLSCLGVGLLFGYMGYRLFLARIWGRSGDLQAEFNNTKVVLKQAAPGTFFALFGAFVIGFTIFAGFDLEAVGDSAGMNGSTAREAKGGLPDELPF